MSTERYNGWKNYPTWNVKLWLDNEPATYNFAQSVARECAEYDGDDLAAGNPFLVEHYAQPENIEAGRVTACADALKCYVESLAGRALTKASFVADLLGWAMDEVDWREIAESYMADVAEASAAQ